MNTVAVSTYRRPFHTRLCLESICRAQRWYGPRGWAARWAARIAVCLAANTAPDVLRESLNVIEQNPDVPFQIWREPEEITNPHQASKWMLDRAFGNGSDFVLYVEDDVILSPDAFLLIKYIQEERAFGMRDHHHSEDPESLIGVCLYHETIPEHYLVHPPDPTRLHLSNGVNTCGGTGWFREPYLKILSPNWNCKTVEPLGFDYSAHYLMYVHALYMIYPDLSRSMNIGFTGGNLSQEQWARYCGRSTWTQTAQALKDWRKFRIEGPFPRPVLEEWMKPELLAKGLL